MKIQILLRYVFLLMVAQFFGQKTYCNPINIDYGYTPFERFSKQGKHRATADPVIVNFKGKLYLFSTNQEGYWWTEDMSDWHYIHRKFLRDDTYKHDLNAPAVWAMKDTLYVYGSTWKSDFPIYKTTEPEKGKWEIAVDTLKVGAWDPAFFYDDDEKLYLFWGSSNVWPILGTEINTRTLQSEGYTVPIVKLFPEDHGWERFGEYNDNVFLQPFIEGAWLTKHNGNYYFQYAAPGTEFSGYADGVYVSDKPLEGYRYQTHNPFAYKPGGFARGAGHGATFEDNNGQYWHVSTIFISVKNNFERRLGIWPAGFDKDEVMYCNTAYGDYPTLLPKEAKNKDFSKGLMAGWMLLNYQKPVKVSSTLGGYHANFAVDEEIKTYWSAATGGKGEWLESDLGTVSEVRAIQINYADQDAEFMGKTRGKFHQYLVKASLDGKNWKTIVDKSKNKKDVPHDYIELPQAINARYIRIENLHMPTGKFALSGFRVFGKVAINAPEKVEDFTLLRTPKEKAGNRMSIWLKWKMNDQADGYVIYWGKSADKLYGSIMVYGKNEYYFTAADRNDAYYFQIEAFNAGGISERSEIKEIE